MFFRMTCVSVGLAAGAALLATTPALAVAPAADTFTVDADGGFTIVAVPTGLSSSRADEVVCTGAFGGKPYDHPHPGHSSDRKKINAHLSIKCTGAGAGATVVTVSSRMRDGRRIGGASTRTGQGGTRVGGDLSCLRQKRSYQALGTISIKFPPRYTPPTASGAVKSVSKPFRQGLKGVCVRP